MNEYVWKLQVEYPEDCLYPEDHEPGYLAGNQRSDWKPAGWVADEEWIERYGSEDFFWPKVERIYRSRSAAVRRAQLLERYGAVVKLLRSVPLTFEEKPFPGVLSRKASA
ncbi:hypothetical protein [Rhodococcus sp. SJ-3]|uniref:hypothetical protein n=1 Tax=Rhodococcus sp. SJ-3 TaxID=3454628 RepID=UPI003F7A2503